MTSSFKRRFLLTRATVFFRLAAGIRKYRSSHQQVDTTEKRICFVGDNEAGNYGRGRGLSISCGD